MSQSISFFQFDEKSVRDMWQQCIDGEFPITSTQYIDKLSDIVRRRKSGEIQDLEDYFYEIDDLIVRNYSHRNYNEYASDINTTLSFWLKNNTSKDFERDFDYDVERIDAETWRQLFVQPKKLSEITTLKQNDHTIYEADIRPEDYLDIYLRIKEVYDYSVLADTEMVALQDDIGASERWSRRQNELKTRALPILQRLAPGQPQEDVEWAKSQILAEIEKILQGKGIVSERVELGSSTALGFNNRVCFDVTDDGFTALIDPKEVPTLQERPDANMVTDNFVPVQDKLFINVQNNINLKFWVEKCLEYVGQSQETKAPLNLQIMDSNQIISYLDELLAAGNTINEIVLRLKDLQIVANYELLLQKGATNIDLARAKDSVNPIVVFNNLQVFKNANVPVDLTKIISELDDADAVTYLSTKVKWLIEQGVDPQALADKLMAADDALTLVQEALTELLDAGAHVDGDRLVEQLIKWDRLVEDFYDERDIPIIRRAGASMESMRKLQTYLDDHTITSDSDPEERSIVLNGPQTTKIFFVPQIQIITDRVGRELQVGWAGRILPGQTIEEGIATGLKEVYSYTSRFEWRDIYFRDYAQDRNGNDIERYGVYLTLFPGKDDELVESSS